MGGSELIATGVWTLVALGVAAAIVFGLGVALAVEQRISRWFLPIVFGLVLYMPVVGTILAGRNLGKLDFLLDTVDAAGLSGWVLRLTTVSVIGACLVRILAAMFDRAGPDRRMRAHGTGLFIAFTFYLVTNHLLNAALGSRPSFAPDYIYPLIVFGAIYVCRRQDPEDIVRIVRDGLVATTVASLLAAVFFPSFAIEPKYASLIPGIDFRFWGVGSGPNSTGPMALVLTLLLIHRPLRNRWLNWAAHAGTAVVFVLAQSKTSWIAGVIAVPLLLMYRHHTRVREARATNRSPVAVPLWWLVPITVVFTSAGVVLAFTTAGTQLLDALQGPDVQRLSFTGRDQIWSVVMGEWRDNPLFGYGMTMWDATFRSRIGLPAALSAHNQFLQSLGMAGIIGLAGFVFYFALLCWYALSARFASRGLTVALLAVVGLRCLMETPFVMRPILVSDFLVQMLLFRLAMMRAERIPVVGRQAAAPSPTRRPRGAAAGLRPTSGAVLPGPSGERRADFSKVTGRTNREPH